MKKTAERNPQERPAAPQYGFRKLRPLSIPKTAWIALGLSLVMALTLFVLYGMSFKGTKDLDKTLIIYSDGSVIPEVSFRNSLAAAGFDYVIVDPDRRSSRQDFVYQLPEGYNSEEVVVCAIGSNAFKVMHDLLSSNNSNIEGYILINPDYPGNASLEGYTSDYPALPCAIFGVNTNARTSSELSGAQMIFEKISGVDTLFGHPIRRGKIFPSEVYISPNQMRYLSLSSAKLGTNGLLASSMFQNELAQYLGTTFGNGYSSSRITVWNVVLIFAIFMAVASLALFLFLIPVSVPDKGERALKGRDSLGAIIFLGLSGWIALCGAVTTFIHQIRFLASYVALYSPVLIIALMAMAQIKLLASRKVTYTRKDYGPVILLASGLVGVVELMLIVSVTLILTNVEKTFTNTTNLIIALVVFIVMSISAVCLILADKKSRFSGQGSTAYFASPMYFFEALIPSVVLLVLGLIQDDFSLIASSLGGCALGILPFVCATPIKRISDYYEISGLVFGIVAALIVFASA